MMHRIVITFLWLPFAFKILSSLTYVECEPQTGAIPGGFAGAPTNGSLIYNMTNTTHPATHLNESFPATIIQRGETFPNGCFKQIVKEPDYSNVKRYITTEQLICPPNVNITMISQQYHKPSNATVLMPVPTTQHANVNSHPAVPPYATVYRPPPNMPVPVYGTPNAPPAVMQQKDQPAVFQPRQPVAAAETPNVATSQVIVLSQQTGYYDTKKKTNSANTTLLAVNMNVILLFIAVFNYFI